MPISAVIVSKNGSTASISINENFTEDLYKKCGFKSNNGFRCVHEWSIEFNNIVYGLRVYGKTTGRAGSENTYEFPPPMDKTMFFSKCAVINTVNNNPVDLSSKEFADIMEYLHGGFEDIGSSSDEDSHEDDDANGIEKTKEGYVKDDFVVESEEEDMEVVKKPKPAKKTKPAKSKEPVYYIYGDELTEEEYV